MRAGRPAVYVHAPSCNEPRVTRTNVSIGVPSPLITMDVELVAESQVPEGAAALRGEAMLDLRTKG
jgi:hypothetical protein